MFGELIDKYFGGAAKDVFKGMTILAIGSGLSKIIGIAAIPFLTRIYSPEDFGILSIFTAFLAILTPFLTLRYLIAIPLPRQALTAFHLMILSFLLMMVFILILTFFLLNWSAGILIFFSAELLIPYWWLISLGVLVGGVYEILSFWASRERNYKVIAQANILQTSMSTLVKIILGLLLFKPMGLLFGHVVSKGGGGSLLLKRFWLDFKLYYSKFRFLKILAVAKKYKKIPIYRVPSQLLLVFSMQTPMLFIAWLYGAESAGQFGLALMVISIPLSLIGHTMGKALMAESAKLGVKKASLIYKMTKQVQVRLLILGALPVATIFFYGDVIFELVFGSEWALAGRVATIVSIYSLFQFTSAPLMQLIVIFDKQSIFLWLNFIRALSVLGVIFLTLFFVFSFEEFVILYSVLNTLFFLFASYLVLRVVYLKSRGGNVAC
jgi:O-antigen/teichoic acid export membrane protein